LRKALVAFAQNCNGVDSRQIMLLWEDFIITQLKELNPEFDGRSVESIPKLLCKDNNSKMVQEFIKQDEKIANLVLASVYNTPSRV
jgi:hypothetical protein